MTQQVFTPFSIQPVVINPSVMEGEMAAPSILGPDAHIAIQRFPPVNTTLPYVSGDPLIPSTLTANPGVWTGSPKPTYEFQWYSDDVLIDGAVSATFTTDDTLTDTDMSFLIWARSPQGDVSAVSPGFTVQSIYPQNIEEASYYVITGAPVLVRQVMVTHRFYVVEGQPIENQIFQASHDIYVVEDLT